MLRTAPTSRGHVAVTGGQGSGQRGLAQYPEGGVVQRGQGKGGEERRVVAVVLEEHTRRCGVTVMSGRVECNHC